MCRLKIVKVVLVMYYMRSFSGLDFILRGFQKRGITLFFMVVLSRLSARLAFKILQIIYFMRLLSVPLFINLWKLRQYTSRQVKYSTPV